MGLQTRPVQVFGNFLIGGWSHQVLALHEQAAQALDEAVLVESLHSFKKRQAAQALAEVDRAGQNGHRILIFDIQLIHIKLDKVKVEVGQGIDQAIAAGAGVEGVDVAFSLELGEPFLDHFLVGIIS